MLHHNAGEDIVQGGFGNDQILEEMVMMSLQEAQGQITLIAVLEVIKSQTFSQVLIQRQQIVNK
jgi:hypothetical protein